MASGSVTRKIPYDQFVIQSHTIYSGETIASKDSINRTVTITKSGYYPLSIAGWSATGSYSGFITPGRMYLNNQVVGSCDVVINFQNNRDSSLTSQGFAARVLWVKV